MWESLPDRSCVRFSRGRAYGHHSAKVSSGQRHFVSTAELRRKSARC
jgi:hypothetical protein